jgi:virginiamycin B lyase
MISASGQLTSFTLPGNDALAIVTGPDGNLWCTNGQTIDRMTTSGTLTVFPLPDGVLGRDLTWGSDGNIWFTECGPNGSPTTGAMDHIGRMTPNGDITQFAVPTGTFPYTIVNGPDGNLYGSPGTIRSAA